MNKALTSYNAHLVNLNFYNEHVLLFYRKHKISVVFLSFKELLLFFGKDMPAQGRVACHLSFYFI